MEEEALKQKSSITFIILFLLSICVTASNAQFKTDNANRKHQLKNNILYSSETAFQDTTKPGKKPKDFTLHGIFLSVGGGLSVPLSDFNGNSNVTFGLLGRLEYSSTVIFPLVIGGEVNYFSYNGDDQFKTLNLLTNLKTKIFSYGLNLEYTFSRLLNSSYTIPFITLDVKNNIIKREYDDAANLPELPREQTKISIGGGIGFTLFVFDFTVKYNYMKTLSNIGVYTKIKFPLIRF
jgi:hypothetical protein